MNSITVSHPDRKKIVMLRRAFRKGQMCNYIRPVPPELSATMAGSFSDKAMQEELEAMQESNLEKHGYKNWYDFCVGEWGTKWDVGERGSDNRVDANTVTLYFDSAWSPPMEVYKHMIEDGYSVDAMYYEPGMGFCGRFLNGVGLMTDISEMSADDVEAQIDPDIDSEFSISDGIRLNEEENEEELTTWIKEGVEARRQSQGET